MHPRGNDLPACASNLPNRRKLNTFSVTTGVLRVVLPLCPDIFSPHVPIVSRQHRGLRRTVSWCSCAAGTEICSTRPPRISTSWARCARRQRPIFRDNTENARSEGCRHKDISSLTEITFVLQYYPSVSVRGRSILRAWRRSVVSVMEDCVCVCLLSAYVAGVMCDGGALLP